jgi:Putative DNA-binding domain
MMQAEFAAALLDPAAAMPDGLVDAFGRVDAKRFSVYRNNVAASLTRVLEAAFPVVRKLVGDDFFAAMAGEFLRARPPKTRIMMLYGAEFAGFLKEFPPVVHLGYLPDIARLEQTLRESYHAPDAVPVAPEVLAALDEATFLGARLVFAPSLRLIRSVWPIHAIWCANAEDGPPPVAGVQDVVVLRPGFDPRPHLLPPGGGAVLAGLLAGKSLDAAVSAAGPDVDLAAVLAILLGQGALVEVKKCTKS